MGSAKGDKYYIYTIYTQIIYYIDHKEYHLGTISLPLPTYRPVDNLSSRDYYSWHEKDLERDRSRPGETPG